MRQAFFLVVGSVASVIFGVLAVLGNIDTLRSWLGEERSAQIISLASSMPPWAYPLIISAMIFACHELYKHTYSREIVTKADNQLTDLRAGPETELDFSRGQNALIRPQGEVVIHPPVAPREGVFKVFILTGDKTHAVTFADRFESVGPQAASSWNKPHRLYEIQVVIIRDGRQFRYFISDPLAYLTESERLHKEVADLVEEAEHRGIAMTLGTGMQGMNPTG